VFHFRRLQIQSWLRSSRICKKSVVRRSKENSQDANMQNLISEPHGAPNRLLEREIHNFHTEYYLPHQLCLPSQPELFLRTGTNTHLQYWKILLEGLQYENRHFIFYYCKHLQYLFLLMMGNRHEKLAVRK
jgi:hypothetical protein